ncbi:MAG: glycosyltransferase [Candidatus Bathyarchaeia archaeon]
MTSFQLMKAFSVILAEVMACGCVLIVTKSMHFQKLLETLAFYVPYNDPKATAEAIQKALKSNKGINARKRVQKCFSIKAREEKILKEISYLLSKARLQAAI